MTDTIDRPRAGDVDLVGVEIFSRALENIANEMGVVMMRASGSPVIAEAVDFSTFIADADGEIIAFAGYITLHLGPARQAVRHLLETIPRDRIHPGDAFICNDPHTTGTAHQPDVGIVRPIFAGDELIAWCWSEAHVLDVGGIAPGGFAPMATETYGEGLRFPGVKIVDRGEIVDDVWRLITANVRIPAMVLNDIRCFIAACNRCDERIQELVGQYGVDTFKRNVAIAKDLAEAAVRSRVASLPDGVYDVEDFVEHNGHANVLLPVRCRATVDGDKLTFDLTESSDQTDGFVNCARAVAIGCALTPILMALVPDLPINEGTIRAIEIVTRPGSICDPIMPAPTSSGHMECGLKVMRCVERILADVMAVSEEEFVREHVMAPWHDCWPGGVFYAPNEAGELVPFLDMHGGSAGGGAQPVDDGMDVSASLAQPQSSIPDIEVNELQFPVLYLWRRINAGSGGPGRLRGGQGVELAWTPWRTPGGQEHVFASCWQVPPTGTQGGYPGSGSGFTLVTGAGADASLSAGRVPAALADLDGTVQELEAKQFGLPVGPGDVVLMHTGGGGGLGDPLEREPERVLRDVVDGSFTRDLAESVFGVVVADGAVDAAATDQRRTALREERRSWPEGAAPPAPGTTDAIPARVRRRPAAEALAAIGGWVHPREGVELVEYADPATGALLRVDVEVTQP